MELICIFQCAMLFLLVQSLAGGTCYTELPSSSCSPGQSCSADHPPSDEESQCQYMYNGTAEMPAYMQKCPKTSGGLYKRCNELSEHNYTVYQYFKVTSVSSQAFSLDPEHFAMNISWKYNNYDYNNAISRGLRGYEVRVSVPSGQKTVVVDCWCLSNMSDPSVFSVTLGLDLTFPYIHPTTVMNVQVLTLPWDNQFTETVYLRSQDPPPPWPESCHSDSVLQTAGSCTPPLLSSPQDIRAYSRQVGSGKDLNVSWSCSSDLPQSYYVCVANQSDSFSTVVNGTCGVVLTGLNSNQTYSVQVQAYSHCSGTSSYLSGFSQDIGCGTMSSPVVETPELLPVETTGSTTTFTTSTTTTTTTGGRTDVAPTTEPPELHLLLPVLLTSLFVLLLAVLVPISILAAVMMYRYCRTPPSSPDGYFGQSHVLDLPPEPVPISIYGLTHSKPLQLDVLVLYSLRTPLQEKVLIEKHIVCFLKQKFVAVHSCNDYTEKTVMEWVEEQVRHAHSVLIICNKTFHREWNSQYRTPLINSLERIITCSVAHKNTTKFATVVLKSDTTDNCIPEYMYLKAMTCYSVGGDSKAEEDDDMDNLISFVKHNRQIRHSTKI